MLNSKLTDGTIPNLSTPADGDLLYIVDVSDPTDHAAGTSKVITFANLFKSASDQFEVEHNTDGTHNAITGASAVISGAVSAGSISTDTISEKTSGAGVTIDGVLLKDGGGKSALVTLTNHSINKTDNFATAANANWQDVTDMTFTLVTIKASKIMISASARLEFTTAYSNFAFYMRVADGAGNSLSNESCWDLGNNVTTSGAVTASYVSASAETVTIRLQIKKIDASANLSAVNSFIHAFVIPD